MPAATQFGAKIAKIPAVNRKLKKLDYFPDLLDSAAQQELLTQIITILDQAPLFTPTMPRTGKPFSVRMSNCGDLGWVSDKQAGYRYQPTHPQTGNPWPPMPKILQQLWREKANYEHPPQACLINYYAPTAKMGLHQDRDEQDFAAPVLSVSLGDSARFRLGGQKRSDPTNSIKLNSGDVMLLADENRLAFHGIDRIYGGSSRLLVPHADIFGQAGRINLTLRRVSRP